ncbi:MAG TPA: DegT/DnrJ/EryC1/StrS family aminotransferase, partial [Terriglobales bacterium]
MKPLLAIDGARPTLDNILPPWPYFAPDEIEAAGAVLASGKVNYWTGEEGRHFESEYAAYVGTGYAIATANGTVALELALHALGIGPGDEVIVPSRTFIATASCAVMRGAVPVIA